MLLVLVLLVAFLGLLFLLQSLLMSCVGQECGTDSGVPFDNLNQERPTPVDPEGRNLCMLDSDRGMCMAAMPREDGVQLTAKRHRIMPFFLHISKWKSQLCDKDSKAGVLKHGLG